MFENIDRVEDTAIIAQKLLSAISEPYPLGNRSVFISASIGISLFPKDSEEVDGLVKRADAAMYRVKEQGKNNYGFFSNNP